MAAMHKLDADSIRLLGSTEVAQSPQSVVKELVENSLDAGATRITVRMDEGGLAVIEVSDNGCGITAESMKMIGERHCTSKAKSAADLAEGQVQTYGFRGEALASIATVAGQLTIATCCPGEPSGRRYVFDLATHRFSPTPQIVAMQAGTIITCSKLFNRLPVRRDYYAKSKQRQKDAINQCRQFVTGLSLCRLNCRISLKHNSNQTVWETASGFTVPTVLALIAGPLIGASDFQHLEVESLLENSGGRHDEPYRFECWLPAVGRISNDRQSLLFRSSADSLYIVVNDRPIECKEIAGAIKTAFSDCGLCVNIKTGYPIGCAKLTLPRRQVDCNVDVAKRHVFFGGAGGSEAIVEAIKRAVTEFLLKNSKTRLDESLPLTVVTPQKSQTKSRRRNRTGQTDEEEIEEDVTLEIEEEPVSTKKKRRLEEETEDFFQPSSDPVSPGLDRDGADLIRGGSGLSNPVENGTRIVPGSDRAETGLLRGIGNCEERPQQQQQVQPKRFSAEQWSRGRALPGMFSNEQEQPVEIVPKPVRNEPPCLMSPPQTESQQSNWSSSLHQFHQFDRRRNRQNVEEEQGEMTQQSEPDLTANSNVTQLQTQSQVIEIEEDGLEVEEDSTTLSERLAAAVRLRSSKLAAMKARKLSIDQEALSRIFENRPVRSFDNKASSWLANLRKPVQPDHQQRGSEIVREIGRLANRSIMILAENSSVAWSSWKNAENEAKRAEALKNVLIGCSLRRLAEAALFSSMLAGVQLHRRSLGHNFALNNRYLTPSQLNFLANLPSKPSNPPLFSTITDNRVLANGFKIRVYSSTPSKSLAASLSSLTGSREDLSTSSSASDSYYVEVEASPELPEPFTVSTPNEIGPMVAEMVDAMMAKPPSSGDKVAVGLAQCRPRVVVDYFRSEVDRLLTMKRRNQQVMNGGSGDNVGDNDAADFDNDREYLNQLLSSLSASSPNSLNSLFTSPQFHCPHGNSLFTRLAK